jgi:drug/metabolite transporter (DMT)-like permease
MARRDDLLATAALVWAAFLFGTSFVVVKAFLDEVDPIPYLAMRFGLAGLVLYALARRRPTSAAMRRLAWTTGLTYAIGMSLQTIGLQTIDPASSAFLTYLLVVLVPLVEWGWFGRRPGPATVGALAVAVVGLALLTGGGVGLSAGALLTLLAACSFAVHLVQMGLAAERGFDLLRFNALQCVAVAALLGPLVPFTGGVPTTATAWGVSVYAALLVTVATMVPWMWAARRVPPTRAALVLLLEPVFAALGALVTGDPLSPVSAVGAALILVAAAASELAALRRTAATR